MKHLLAFLAVLLLMPLAMLQAVEIHDLRCEYRNNPLGIDVVKPRLSWMIESGRRGERQTGYQVLVASAPELLAKDKGDLWDSGKVESDQSVQVEYAGKPLDSRQRCYWKVRVWTVAGSGGSAVKGSEWSKPASWTMGLLKPEDWQARWIGYDAAYQLSPEAAADDKVLNIQGLKWVRMPGGKASLDTCLRKQVELPADRRLKRAVLALYAFNECVATVNGSVIGRAAHWEATARLDATKVMKPGANVIALTVSHGDPYVPAAIGRLVLQFDAGADVVVPLDQTWKASQKPVAGADQAGFDDAAWPAAQAFDGQPWKGPPPVADLARLPAPYLRKEFTVAKAVKRATVYVTALGVYELHLNGKRVGNDVLAPGWTEFRKRVHYQTYDVTAQISKGANAIGAILGDGWYASDLAHLARRNIYGGRPRFLAQLVIELADGSVQVVASDDSWKAAYGPIRHADLLMGCEYDARLAMDGWDKAGFNSSDWKPVLSDGSSLNDGAREVGDLLRSAIKNGRLAFTVENEALGGDPAPGVVKQLSIAYRQDGQDQEKRFGEHAVVDLGSAEKPVSIQQAWFGRLDKKAAMRVQASVVEPSRVIEELPAIKVTEPKPGCWTFDLGQNMVGWVRLKVKGPAGRRITVRHGEMLNAAGSVYTAALRSCPATDYYILSGRGEEILEPYFTFHGFRYVEVRGLDARPGLDAVTGLVVHTPMRRTGSFECSYPLLNKLYSNIIWGQKGNHLEIPTDCPQRDERMGWTGDTQFFASTGAYNFDVAAFFTRWLQTCEDDQQGDGTFAHVIPDIMGGGAATAWGDGTLLCTYNVYRVYGDTRVVAERFASLDRYMQWLAGKTRNGISAVGGFGDWLNAGGGAKGEVMDTAYHAYLAQIMSEMARAIGREEDAVRYAKRHDEVKAAFLREFLQADGSLKASSQTGYALAFTMDLLPADMKEKAAAKFVDEIKRFNWHLATGFIGTPRLLPALGKAGRDDVAYRLLLTDTYPSWLFPVKNGATTMWERWNGWTPDAGFGDISMNSFNHYAFGAVGEYLYGNVGGIQPASPGYRKITIRPAIDEKLAWAKTSFDSVYGRIATAWKFAAGKLDLEVVVPANTTATVHVPAKNAEGVTESGKPAEKADGVKFLRMENGAAVYEIGSGCYRFSSKKE
jgi:alpha-L-rhamnosidase